MTSSKWLRCSGSISSNSCNAEKNQSSSVSNSKNCKDSKDPSKPQLTSPPGARREELTKRMKNLLLTLSGGKTSTLKVLTRSQETKGLTMNKSESSGYLTLRRSEFSSKMSCGSSAKWQRLNRSKSSFATSSKASSTDYLKRSGMITLNSRSKATAETGINHAGMAMGRLWQTSPQANWRGMEPISLETRLTLHEIKRRVTSTWSRMRWSKSPRRWVCQRHLNRHLMIKCSWAQGRAASMATRHRCP